jgi:hypothetical protein
MTGRPVVVLGEEEGALLRDEELVALIGSRLLSPLLRRRALAGTASQARRAVGATPMPLEARGFGAPGGAARLAECFPLILLEHV